MKTKLFLLLLAACVSTVGFAQGLYSSEDDLSSSLNNIESIDSPTLRKEDPTQGGGEPGLSPIGEGIVILSVLGGGYALLKKRKSNKA